MTAKKSIWVAMRQRSFLIPLIAVVAVALALAVWLYVNLSGNQPTPTGSPTTSQQPTPSSTPTATATATPSSTPTPTPTHSTNPPNSTKEFVKNNRALISSMHEKLNDMIERALNEQFDIVESENVDLERKLLALQKRTPPKSIAAEWATGIERTTEKLAALHAAAIAHRAGEISVDDFLNNFAPLRIELIALDDLLTSL